jgi:hypothetical protein
METNNQKSINITIDVKPIESDSYTHSITVKYNQEGFLQDLPNGHISDFVNGLDDLESQLASCLEVVFESLKPGVRYSYDGTKHDIK